MSIVNLEVQISSLKIKTDKKSGVYFSLRIGRLLSNQTTPIITSPEDSELNPPLSISIACEQSMLKANARASLVVYEVKAHVMGDKNGEGEKGEIIGMVFVPLGEEQFKVRGYRVQQTNDPNSCMQLSFSITPIELKQIQNQSMGQKSSLADIRQLHNSLTNPKQKSHKKTGSDMYTPNKKKSSHKHPLTSPFQEQQEWCQSQQIQMNKRHMKSEESRPLEYDLEDQIVALERELAKERQKNGLLTNLLVIEEEKFSEAERMLQGFLGAVEEADVKINKEGIDVSGQNMGERSIGNKDNGHVVEYNNILKERDQLYTLSQELYQKIKLYKLQNQNLYNSCQNLQQQLSCCVDEIKDLRHKNLDLKSLISQLQCQKLPEPSNQSIQIEHLQQQLSEQQRKLKQIYKALEEFKRDAWAAQEEVLRKDQQIQALKQDLEAARNLSQHHSYQGTTDDHCKQNEEGWAQLMWESVGRGVLQRAGMLSELGRIRGEIDRERGGREVVVGVIAKLKSKVMEYYMQLQKQKKTSIPVVQMKRNITKIINSTQY